MSANKKVGLVFGLILNFFVLSWYAFSITLTFSENHGHLTLSQWIMGLTIGSLPLMFSFWIVYRCFRTDEMEYWDILGLDVRPQALRRALLAELGVCATVFVFWFAFGLIVPYLARRLAS
jgi:hypothetical protein